MFALLQCSALLRNLTCRGDLLTDFSRDISLFCIAFLSTIIQNMSLLHTIQG